MHEGGISDIRRFTAIMRDLPTAFPGKKLVVNMSVDFTVPPGLELILKNLSSLFNGAVAVGISRLSDLNNVLNAIAQALRTAPPPGVVQATLDIVTAFIESLLFAIAGFTAGVQGALHGLTNDDDILVVGAAGNDNNGLHWTPPGGGRPEPRWPAYYEEILAVAATRHDGTVTRYSNLAEDLDKSPVGILLPPDNGIATFGGDVTPPSPTLGYAAGTVTDPTEAVIGIGKIEGTATCLMYWAGTSFATPVISALAANYWDTNQPLRAPVVLADMIGKGNTPVIPDLDCTAITATQERRGAWWP
jgi:hypothetical protein